MCHDVESNGAVNTARGSGVSFTIYFILLTVNFAPGLQKMFSLSGTFIMGKIFCQICARSAHHECIAQSPYGQGPGPCLRALEAKGILMLSGAFWAYI